MNYLCILDSNPSSGEGFANIFYHSIDCLFILSVVYLLCRGFLMRSNYLIIYLFSVIYLFLLLLLVLFVSYLGNCCYDQWQAAFALWFLVGDLQCWGLLFITLINFELIFVSGYPVFPSSFIEGTILSQLNVLGSLIKY